MNDSRPRVPRRASEGVAPARSSAVEAAEATAAAAAAGVADGTGTAETAQARKAAESTDTAEATEATELAEAAGEPRYLQVAGELRRAIAEGVYPVGARLPTELELCEHYGISRYTAREAVRVLSSAGLVTRRQRVGTVVVATPDESRYTHDASSMRDLLQYATDTELRLLYVGRVALGAAQAQSFGARAGEEWVYAVGLRIEGASGSGGDSADAVAGTGTGRGVGVDTGVGAGAGAGAGAGEAAPASGTAAGGRLIGITRVFLSPALEGIEQRLRRRNAGSAIHALIEQEYGLQLRHVEQEMQAVLLDADDAANLGAAPGAPALRIVRRYYAAHDRLLEVAETVHPADRFTYRMQLRK